MKSKQGTELNRMLTDWGPELSTNRKKINDNHKY